MENILALAAHNQQKARRVIEESDIINIWKSIGAEVNLIGSLKNGLLMKHLDIDFHIYSSPLIPSDSFKAMARLADNPAVQRISYTNLIDTEENCIEWHAWYQDKEGDLWQIDMIHILKGSYYDGYFEKVTDRIGAVLTEETRNAILKIKYDMPETAKAIGIEIYKAVIQDGVRNYADFAEWKSKQTTEGIITWCP